MKPNGQILMDSSDIRYMYETEDLENFSNMPDYYGELDYFISYKGENELPMKWLYLDFETLKNFCTSVGMKCERILEGKHHDYLARLTAP